MSKPNVGGNSGIVPPLIFAALGVYCILFPNAVLEGDPYDKLRDKHAVAIALGIICIGFSLGAHANDYWGAKGYPRVSFWGRLIGGWAGVLGFVYVLSSIIEVSGWPWG